MQGGASLGARWIDLDGNVRDDPYPPDSITVNTAGSGRELVLDVNVDGMAERVRLRRAPAIAGLLFDAIRLLDAQVRRADEARAHAEGEASRLAELLADARRREFGASSEKMPSVEDVDHSAQSVLGPVVSAEVATTSAPVPKPRKANPNAGRKPIDASWPRVDVVVESDEGPPACTNCSAETSFLRYETSERATVVPEHFRVIRTHRANYVCRCCGTHAAIPVEPSFLPGSSFGSPELVAHIAVKKYQYGMPLYRYEQLAASHGVKLSRATCANLVIAAAEKLTPIVELLRETLLQQSAIHVDETVLQVLNEPGRAPQTQSYLWCFQSAKGAERQVVDYRYTTTRAGSNAVEYLTHDDGTPWVGTMQVDGYAGYNKVPGVTRIACMAHIRRKFFEVMTRLPVLEQPRSVAGQVVAMIQKLYLIEDQCSDMSGERVREYRDRYSRPIVEKIKAFLLEHRETALRNTGLGKAIAYAVEQWPHMERYLDEPAAAIDNNRVERALKRAVLGRKAFLFCESQDGAHATASMYAIVETCLANKVDPYRYLVWVMKRFPYAKTAADVRKLLPWCMPVEGDTAKPSEPILA